jgi:signal peptidase
LAGFILDSVNSFFTQGSDQVNDNGVRWGEVRGKSIMKKIAEYFGFAVIVLLLTLAVITLIAPHFGWRVDAVLSGSMEPELKVGSVVIIRPLDIGSVNAGDIITFRSPLNGKLTTHRVISVTSNPSIILRTKGDANEDADPFILGSKSMVGRVCFNIAYLGYVSQFIKSRPGLLLTLYLPGLIIVLMEVKNIWRVPTEEESARKQVVR